MIVSLLLVWCYNRSSEEGVIIEEFSYANGTNITKSIQLALADLVFKGVSVCFGYKLILFYYHAMPFFRVL